MATFKIVSKIAKLLKLDEEGKLQKFFERFAKAQERQISMLEQNIKFRTQEYEIALAQLKDKIEDQQDLVESSYLEVTPSALVSNKAMDDYANTYLANIRREEKILDNLNKQLKDLEDQFIQDVDNFKGDIAKYQAIITKLEAKA